VGIQEFTLGREQYADSRNPRGAALTDPGKIVQFMRAKISRLLDIKCQLEKTLSAGKMKKTLSLVQS
jgi:hypothetical protein